MGAAATAGENTGVVVATVRSRSAAEAAGLAPGDRVLTINGQALRDAIDFQFHAADDRLRLTVERDGRRRAVTVTRGAGDLGVELEPPRPRDIATCANKCVFCFIHQLPRGLRRSLYVKDDDFRLSFLHGNYITLSDLDEPALARIEAQRLSPLYVSVHATDPALRHALLGRPRHDADILPRMERLAKAGIRMHAQVVLCPGLNDGPHLERTVRELAALHPHVATVAIVPVGLTRHRERLPALRTLGDDEAAALVDQVERWQRHWLTSRGSRLVFLGDEVYIQAGRPFPPAETYEGFPVAEDGIGLVRRFEDEMHQALRRWRPPTTARTVSVVTGTLYAPRMATLLDGVQGATLRARAVAVPNELFGGSVGVAGLLAGRDIVRALGRERELGDAVLIPAVSVREGDGVFLDDMTPDELARDVGVRVRVVEPTARALLGSLRGV
jgi:putative radical SAM enzyme (TIGR03279 family)